MRHRSAEKEQGPPWVKAVAALIGILAVGAAFLAFPAAGGLATPRAQQPDPSATPGASATPGTASVDAPNIVFILADDLDIEMGTMDVTPNLKRLVADAGTTLDDFYLTYPLCCPSRTTILRGQYLHSHQVYTNLPPVGGYEKLVALGHEASTVGTWLQGGGYRTVYIGKYLNGYPMPGDPLHIPDGWSEWYSPAAGNPYNSYNYTMNENGALVRYGSAPEDHVTDVIAGQAEAAIRRAAGDPRPFFLHVAPYAPHAPADPAPRHAALFPDAQVPRVPSFNEADVSDKPARIQALEPLRPRAIATLDADYRKRLQSMQAVDEMVARLVEALTETGELDNTYLVFTSDNGFHMGHHRLPAGKTTAYEEDIHAPFLVRGPGVPAGRTVTGYLAGNVDLAPTFADLAGVTPPDFVEGRSLAPLFGTDLPAPADWRQAFLVEGYAGGSRASRGTPAPTTSAGAYGPFGVFEPPDPFDLAEEGALGKGKTALGGSESSSSQRKSAPGGIEQSIDQIEQEEEGDEREVYVALRTLRHTYVESKQTDERELYDNEVDPYQLENLAAQAPAAVLEAFSVRANALHTCTAAACRDLEAALLAIPAFTPGTPSPGTPPPVTATATTPAPPAATTRVPATATSGPRRPTLHLPFAALGIGMPDLPASSTTIPTIVPTPAPTAAPPAIPGTINGCAPDRLDLCAYRPATWVDASAVRAIQGYTVTNATEGRALPVLLRAASSVTGPRPVVVWSHGGGARDEVGVAMNREWATTLARAGYIVVQPAHVSPDTGALCVKLGITDPVDCRALNAMTWYRPGDARAVLDALPELAATVPGLAGRIDLARVAYAGHSFGAFTSMTVAGARVDYAPGHMDVSWAHPLPRAFLALSPQGPDRFGFHANSWREIGRPVLTASGAGDTTGAPPAGEQAEERREPFRRMPAGDKHELWIESADAVHGTFNLSGQGAGERFTEAVAMTAVAFLDAHVLDHAPAKAWLASNNVRVLAGGEAEWNHR
jgi:N-acetylglucosamine-6-sulfatase